MHSEIFKYTGNRPASYSSSSRNRYTKSVYREREKEREKKEKEEEEKGGRGERKAEKRETYRTVDVCSICVNFLYSCNFPAV